MHYWSISSACLLPGHRCFQWTFEKRYAKGNSSFRWNFVQVLSSNFYPSLSKNVKTLVLSNRWIFKAMEKAKTFQMLLGIAVSPPISQMHGLCIHSGACILLHKLYQIERVIPVEHWAATMLSNISQFILWFMCEQKYREWHIHFFLYSMLNEVRTYEEVHRIWWYIQRVRRQIALLLCFM